MDWLGSSFAYMMFAWGMLLFIIILIYIKFYFHVFYKGTLYRHYRRGRLLTENNQGGKVALIPFIDKLEVFEKESSDFD
ncbi:MAG: hypothetical protein ACFFBL_05515 [Promethearchaeota archaeon]